VEVTNIQHYTHLNGVPAYEQTLTDIRRPLTAWLRIVIAAVSCNRLNAYDTQHWNDKKDLSDDRHFYCYLKKGFVYFVFHFNFTIIILTIRHLSYSKPDACQLKNLTQQLLKKAYFPSFYFSINGCS
jgi:hypothetical protein